jgi:gluconolactonase
MFAIIATLLTAAVGARADDSIIAPGATLQKLAGGFKFTEGCSSDSKGNIFFTDQPNDRIMEWSVDGKLTTFLQPCGRSNGTCFDSAGNLWACADEHNQLWKISPDGKTTPVVTEYDGHLLNGPNDVWIRPDGGLYITDPYYRRDYWTRGPKEQPCEGVYYLPPGGTQLTQVVSDMVRPNGIIGAPDGKTLYVSDIDGGRTYAYDIQADGSLANKRLFCNMGSDGMTIDSAGDIYITGHGVTIFDKNGVQIDHIDIAENWTGNICFGGSDRKLLFITASTSIYGLQMSVHGVGSQ